MKNFTLSIFLNFFTSKYLAFNNTKESGFKLDFSNQNSTKKVNSNQSSRTGISSIIILLVLFLFSNFLTAQIITVDGLTSDWSNNPAIKHVQDPFGNGVVDNQFTEGSKDFLPAIDLAWVIGQTKAKNDIANGGFGLANQVKYVDINNVTQTLNGSYLVFSGDRTSNNGDAQIGFWFYLNSTGPVTVSGNRYFAPPHVRGDLLVLADFTGGGRLGTVKVYRWIGGGATSPGSTVVDNTNGNLETTNIASIVAENNNGTPNVPNYGGSTIPLSPNPNIWYFPSAQYKTNEFYEGFVDLVGIGGNTNFTCSATVLLETRSSQSITASLDDFIGGTLGEVPTVTINSPSICAGGSTTITATPSPAGTYTYAWTVPQGASNPGNVASFSATVAGSYSVIVTTQAGCPSSLGSGTLIVNANPVVTVNSPIKCANDSAVNISASVSPAGTYTYVWSVPVGASNPGNVASFSSSVAGTYSVVVSNASCSGSNSGILTVNPNPTCSISGASSVCPNSIENVHSGPAGAGLTYAWSISGNGSIVGVANEQNVSVTAGSSCGVSYTISLTVSTSLGCSSTCTKTVAVGDSIAPSFTFCPLGSELGCNPTGVPEPGNATATDNCGTPTITSALGSITSNGCLRSQTRTYTATDGCGNTATCAQVFTWTADTTPPAFTGSYANVELGCNPTSDAIMAALDGATATDDCGEPRIAMETGSVESQGCLRSQTRTFTATDACGNQASISRTVTWTVVSAPVFDNCVSGTIALGCNPTPPTCATDITAYNECGPVKVDCSAGDIIVDGFNRSQTFTYTAAGACGFTSTCIRTFTWFVSEPFTCLDPVSTTILCGVTKIKSQVNTDNEFSDWLNSFAYDTNLYTVEIDYVYDLGTVKSDNGDGPKNPNADATAKVTVTWTLTNKETGCKESCSSTFIIENGCRILCSYVKTDVLCEGEETGTITVTASGATLPYVVQLFEDGNPVAIATETSADDAEPFTITFENLPAGLYSYVVSDDYQRACTTDTPIEVGKGTPCGANCTYTQGYYGNLGGTSCADGVSYTTSGLIQKALESYGGTMTIGLPGHSVWMKSTEDIDDIIRVLPGGGSSYVLPAVDKKLSDISGSSTYLRKGNINSTLLAQTITLGLNLGIDSELGSFKLQGGILATADPLGGCGSKTKVVRVCNPDGTVTNDYQYFAIPANVVNALTDKTIQGLFDMANKALGNGGVPAGLSLSNIANVVDLINNAFDECRIFVGFDIPACPVPDTVPSPIIELAKGSSDSKIGFDAYPVPFRDVLTIKYKFDYVSNVKIEVINSQGISILTKNDANSYLNKEVTLNLKLNKGKEQVYFVKVTTNRGSTVKQVLSSTE